MLRMTPLTMRLFSMVVASCLLTPLARTEFGSLQTARTTLGKEPSPPSCCRKTIEEKAMNDATENVRRALVQQLATDADDRTGLEARYGQIWDTAELKRDFEVIGFCAPIVGVRRRSDGVRGSLLFQRSPRFYFGFKAE
jgi:hypothetical protein